MSNKIDQIVRFYVKKYLTEVANDLEVLVKKKVRERMDLVTLLREEKKETPSLNEVADKSTKPEPARRKLRPEDLGITDSTWKSVYEDTLNSGNPILLEDSSDVGDQPSDDRPEHVSEAKLQEAGFMKDYSKHLNLAEEKDRQKRGDPDLEAKRREILQKTIS